MDLIDVIFELCLQFLNLMSQFNRAARENKIFFHFAYYAKTLSF